MLLASEGIELRAAPVNRILRQMGWSEYSRVLKTRNLLDLMGAQQARISGMAPFTHIQVCGAPLWGNRAGEKSGLDQSEEKWGPLSGPHSFGAVCGQMNPLRKAASARAAA
jgi:hypothetical protein